MRKAVVVIAALLAFASLGALVIDVYLSKDNVTVSGKAVVSGVVAIVPTIQKTDFTYTQTAAPTASPIPIPIPSVPKFALQLVGPPYEVNTTYYEDENTGQIVTDIGYTNQYSYLEIKIKNQPFTPFVGDEHGNTVQIQYNVRIKQSNQTNNWVEVYSPYNGYPIQSNSDPYTTIRIPIEGGLISSLGSIAGTQSDIQVEALAGYVHRMVVWSPSFGAPYVFNGTESGWSETQIVSVPENILNTPTPSVPEFSWLTILPILIAIPIVLLIIRKTVTRNVTSQD